MRCATIAFFLLLAAGPQLLHAGNCAAIKDLKLPGATLTMAERVSSGDVEGPACNIDPWLAGILPGCRDSASQRRILKIRFEIWLPEKEWNGSFLGVAAKYTADNKVAMTRPLCPYPEKAKYKGAGDTNEAASFVCAKD